MTIDKDWIIKDLNDIFEEFVANNWWKDKLRCASLIGRIDTLRDLEILTEKEADEYQSKAEKLGNITVEEFDKILFYGD